MEIRKCGACQLCCKLLPVREISKVSNTRCMHQRFMKGCAIYARRPPSCQHWSCKWLLGAPINRPDRSHYVVDMLNDAVAMQEHTDSPVERLVVAQVWCDPEYPDAHRDPKLRAYLRTLPTRGFAIVRYGVDDGFLLIPPDYNVDGDWYEKPSTLVDNLPEEAA